MALPVSYPGVYVDEFAPGAPIEGAGTNTAVLLGVPEKGPRNIPTLISSWDQFTRTFGGFLAAPGAWLAQGACVSFATGSTRCYVVPSSTGTIAKATLSGRNGGDTLIATA